MEKKKELVIPTNSDVTLSLQLAEVTITTNNGTISADDELCVTLRDVQGSSLSAFLTAKQVDGLLSQLNRLRKSMIRKG